MQLTIDLEQDLYSAAERLARQEQSSVSTVINKLLRRVVPSAINSSPPSPKLTNAELDYQLLPSKGSRPFGPEDVARLEEDDFR